MKSPIEAALLEVLADEHANEWDTDLNELGRNQSPTLQRMMFETLRLLHNEVDYHPSVNELRVLDEFAARIL